MLMPRVITSVSAQIDPGREDELPDGNSGQQPTALSARCRCAGRVVPGASRRPRVTSTPNGGPKQWQTSGSPGAARRPRCRALICSQSSLESRVISSLVLHIPGWHGPDKCGSACRTRRRIAELISDADDLLAGFDSLPVTLAHHDPQWGNLFAAAPDESPARTVAIDWGFIGLATIGSDLGLHIGQNIMIGALISAAPPSTTKHRPLRIPVVYRTTAGMVTCLDRARFLPTEWLHRVLKVLLGHDVVGGTEIPGGEDLVEQPHDESLVVLRQILSSL